MLLNILFIADNYYLLHISLIKTYGQMWCQCDWEVLSTLRDLKEGNNCVEKPIQDIISNMN